MIGWYEKITNYIKNKISNVGIVITDDIYRLYELTTAINENDGIAYFIDLQLGDLDSPPYAYTLLDHGKITKNRQDAETPAQFLYSLSRKGTVIVKWVVNSRIADRLEPILFSLHSNIDMYDDTKGRYPILFFSNSYYWNIIDLASVEVIPTDKEYEDLMKQAEFVYSNTYNKKVELPSVDVIKGLNLWTAQGVLRNSVIIDKKITFNTDKINEFKKEIFHKLGITLIKSDINFDFVGGQERLKEYINNKWKSILLHPNEAKKYGVRLPRGMILYGPPGTGKSWFVKALAGELNLLMLQINGSDIFSKWVGESENKLKSLIRYADLASAVVFIDEIDAIASKRTSEEHEVTRRVKNMLLEWLGDPNRRAIVIGATNMVQDIDEAFKRPGRFDDILPVSYPTEKDLVEMYTVHIYKYNPIQYVDDLDLEEVARKSHEYYMKPNEVEKVTYNAKLKAFLSKGKLTTDLLLEEVKEIGKDIDVAERRKFMEEYEKEDTQKTSFTSRWL